MSDNIRGNIIVNIVRTVALTLLSFLTFPYICRVLGEETLGLYTWANTFVYYFLILAKIGIPNLAVRECVKVRHCKQKLSNTAQAFFLLQSVTTILSFLFMCTLVFSVPELREAQSLIFLLSINFISGAFSFEWIYIALEKQFYMSLRSIIILAIDALLIVSIVTNKDDVYIYALLTAGVTLITTIVNLFYVGKYISFKKTAPYNYKQYIRPLITLCILSFTLALYNQTDEFILGFLDTTKGSVGAYSVGVKGVDIIIGIIAALGTVFIPRAAFYYEKEDKRFFNNLTRYSINICLFIVLPAIMTMCALSNQICSLISGNYINNIGEFDSSPIILVTLASMMLTYSLSDLIYGQILLPMKKEKYYLYSILGGTILNISLSFIFGLYITPNTPEIGVAIATTLTDILVLVFLLAVSWKWIKKGLFSKNSLKLVIANILVLAASLILTYALPIKNLWATSVTNEVSLILELVVIVLIDAIIYLGTLLLLKEDLVYSFIRKEAKQI